MEVDNNPLQIPLPPSPPTNPVAEPELEDIPVAIDTFVNGDPAVLQEEDDEKDTPRDAPKPAPEPEETAQETEKDNIPSETPVVQVTNGSDHPETVTTDEDSVQQTARRIEIKQGPVVEAPLPSPSGPPPTPPSKLPPLPEDSVPVNMTPQRSQNGQQTPTRTNGHTGSPSPSPSPISATHRRSLTISKGHTVSVVLISSALDIIAASKEAKRSAPLRESTQRALDMVRSGQGGDRPRVIFEPLRLACETRNEKLMIASLDCISKLISYSFFAEQSDGSAHSFPSPPPSPGPNRASTASASQASIPEPSLVDLVTHTITACHNETTPETVSLQIVKALLSMVLSPTIFVHHSSLLKAVRTVYNVFLLSTDPVNQMVAQGGLTQMVHHVFTRCKIGSEARASGDSNSSIPSPSPSQPSFSIPTPEAHVTSFPNGDSEVKSTAVNTQVPTDSSSSLPTAVEDGQSSSKAEEEASEEPSEEPQTRLTL